MTTLALQVAEALGGQGRVRVRFDDSLFTGPTDNPAWRRDYVPDDIVSPITALMVDGGDEPDSDLKSDEPSLAAALLVAEEVGVKDRFVELARQELRLRKNQLEKLDDKKAAIVQEADKSAAAAT